MQQNNSDNENNKWQNLGKVSRYESWRYYWKFFLFTTIFVVMVFIISMHDKTISLYVGGFGGFFLLLHIIMRLWVIFSCKYTIEGGILKIRQGLIFRVVSKFPLKEIKNIVLNQTPEEKSMAVGSLLIKTKGLNVDYAISRVSDPEKIKEHIQKMQEMVPS